jgi:catechol 2,3-dioxygenase-like lactoylglutathione lyase family enzyme
MDKSLVFYRDVLGMNVIKDEVEDTTTGGLPHTYKHPRKTRRTVHVTYGQGQIPSLVLTSHPGDQPDGAPIKLDQVGISHISFTVGDVKALAQELASHGVQLAGGLEAFADAQGNVRTIFAYDPDGILVQFDSGVEG